MKDTKALFQIGEVCKTLGLSRRIILNYEAQGLLTPAYQNPDRGFRYYSADNIVHIRLIRALQKLGLSLSEIRGYFDGNTGLDASITHLELLRDQLNRCIGQLRLRQADALNEQFLRITLPASRLTAARFPARRFAERGCTHCCRKTGDGGHGGNPVCRTFAQNEPQRRVAARFIFRMRRALLFL